MSTKQWLKIDVDAVLRERLPRYYRFIPKILVSWLKREICQDEMNGMLSRADGLEGAQFCRSVLDYLRVSYEIQGQQNLPPAADRKVTYVSNHPLGGLDGMALIEMATARHGVEPYFVVNDLLMAVEPLRKVFVPVNTHGRQSRRGTAGIDEAFASDRPVIVFPAGLVSRKGNGGRIADLKWRTSAIHLSVTHRRDIIPVYFDGTNSGTFYGLARARERLGLRFNFEMIRLPREIMLSRGKKYTIHIGKRIPVDRLQGGRRADDETLAVRKIVYNLKKDN